MTAVWDLECSSLAQKLVLLALADNANDDGHCWPSIPTIARKCGLCRQSVIDQIKALSEAKLVEVEKHLGRGNRYQLTGLMGRLVTRPASRPVQPVDPSSQQATPVYPVDHHPSTQWTGPVYPVDPNHKEPSVEPSRNHKSELTTPDAKTVKATEVPIPVGLDTPDFRVAWAGWLCDRKERKVPVTARAAGLHLKRLEPFGPELAIIKINLSIEKAWKGIVFPEDGASPPANNRTGQVRRHLPTDEDHAKGFWASDNP